nr:helix-turn-helix transcriptional regulator [Rhodoferax sp.]
MTDEFFEVSKCEPDPGWDDAFIFDCVELSRVPGLGQGKVMCNFKLTNSGYEFGFTPFVSEHVDVRLMAILKALGMTLKDIGSLIDKDKSNVSRVLNGVPLLKKVPFTKVDLKRWLESCGTGPEQIRKSMVIFAELEKANVVAEPAQEVRNDRNTRNPEKRKPR